MKKQIIILSGETMDRTEIGCFVIDPGSIQLHKPRLIVDYNHNEEEVIGYVDNIHENDGKLMGDLTLESTSPNDRAAEVIARIEGGTPYEISPTVMLYDAGVETETVTGGDEEYTIFRNVPMRGVSICPYGTDRLTTILSLNGGKKTMKKRTKKNLTKLAADEILDEAIVETTVADEAAGEGEGGAQEYTAYPLLEEFIAAFGFDLGVEYYRRGYTMEEAEAADYAALKAARLAAENEEISEAGAIEEVAQIDDAVPEAAAEAALVEEAQAAVEEAQDKTGLKANIVLAKTIRALAQEVTKLKALSVRGTDALASSQRKAVPMTAVQKMANKIHNRK